MDGDHLDLHVLTHSFPTRRSSDLGIYDRFRTYIYDEETSVNYGAVGDSLYNVNHSPLPNIASEWTTYGFTEGPAFFDLAALSHDAFTVFAPRNQALKTFFDSYFPGYYLSLQACDMLPLAFLLFKQ